MKIDSVAILGLGLIGGSIAKALKKSGQTFTISAFDKDDVINKALEENVIDYKLNKVEDSLNSQLIFLCLPVDTSLKIFKDLAPKLSDKNILTDVCSVKNVFETEWKELRKKGYYIGGHPMTGKERGGYDNSDMLLFENSIYIISDNVNDFPYKNSFIEIIELLGARVRVLSPALHDKIAAYVSHLPQLLSVLLMNSVSKNQDDINYLDFAAGGFRDMTRIASSDFTLWESIISNNKNDIITSLDDISKNIDELKSKINSENYTALQKLFDRAKYSREKVPQNNKGFISPLYEIFVTVRDEPGILSKISTSLFDNNVNIKDIELLKIREGQGGTFRLSFDSAESAQKAKKLIDQIGFRTN